MKTGIIITLVVVTLSAVCLWLARPGNGGSPSVGPQYGVVAHRQSTPTYHLAVHPLHNPAKLAQVYQPLIDHLNARLKGAQVVLESSTDYANFEAKYQARKPEIILPNPWQTIQAMQAGYGVVATAGDPEDFRGIILVRADGGIAEPADLKGRKVSYPSPTALAACIMPQYFLHQHGIDITKDLENCYVGSQESSIMNVYARKTVAGVTWPPPWRLFQKDHPVEAAELRVAWETEPLINNSLMIRDDIPADQRGQIRQILAGLATSPTGKAVLAAMGTSRFILATDQDYEVVRGYVQRFEREVRTVKPR